VVSAGSLFNHIRPKPYLIYRIHDLGLSHFVGIERDFSSFFLITDFCLFHTFKPFQGFLNDQRSRRSGHTLDLEKDFASQGMTGRKSHHHCENNRQRKGNN
jgi:hypothetical protein